MIGIADPKLWNLGVGLLSKWSSLTFSFFFYLPLRVLNNLNKVFQTRIGIFFFLRPVTLPRPGLGRNMFARGNCGLSGESMTASLMHLLVLVHLRILNWLIVNSPRTMEQRIIPDLRRGIDGDSQISKNRM